MAIRISVRAGILTVILLGLGCSSDPASPAGPPVAVRVSPTDTAIRVGTTVRLRATLVDAEGREVDGGTTEWSALLPSVVSVTTTGTATGVSLGESSVSAFIDGFAAAVSVTVFDSSISTRLKLPGSPFGLALAGSKSYVTLVNRDSLAVLSVPLETRTGGIGAGIFPTDVAFAPSGARAYATNQGPGSVSVIVTTSNTVSDSTLGPASALAVATSSDGSRIWATSGATDQVFAFDAATLGKVDSTVGPEGPNELVRHPTLQLLYVSGSFDGEVLELDAGTLDLRRGWSLGGAAQGMAVSPGGTKLYVANEAGWLDVIDIGTGAQTTVTLPSGGFGVAVSPDGTRLAVGVSSAHVLFLDTATMNVIKDVPTGGVPRRMAFNDAGTRLLVANESGWVDFIR